ncbi:MAG: hypothetical protein KDA77_23925 [Planctomycetaceae bacterium]|nr:hypothetical protein [Planctomycetaceae bacterium]
MPDPTNVTLDEQSVAEHHVSISLENTIADEQVRLTVSLPEGPAIPSAFDTCSSASRGVACVAPGCHVVALQIGRSFFSSNTRYCVPPAAS